MGKLPNYLQYFGPNIEGVPESWVETEMSWVEVEMSWVEVDGAGWRWMELGRGGWSWVWVHSLVIPVIKNGNDFINKLRLSRKNTFISFMVSSSL